MHILHLIPALSGGGAERQMCYLARAQSQAGDSVTIGYSAKLPVPDELAHANLHRIPVKSNYDPRLAWKIAQLIRRQKPDVVHTWILQMDIVGGLAAIATRTPWIIREPSMASSYPHRLKAQTRIAVARRADAIVSNSAAGDHYWQDRAPHTPRYIVVNGLDFDAIDAAPRAQGPVNCKRIVFAGRLDNDAKNLDRLIEALVLVRQRLNIEVLLCGDGPYRKPLQRAIAQHRANSWCRLLGHVSNVWSLMKTADAVVSISRFEGRPNSVIEAMACGAPLVVSTIPQHLEFLDHSSAWLAPPDDTDAIASQVMAAVSDPGESARRATVAQGICRQWTIEAMATAYRQIYCDSISRRGTQRHLPRTRQP